MQETGTHGAVTANERRERLAHLLQRLGGISPERILSWPAPGMATEEDLLVEPDGNKLLCELLDGVLVEKAMGWYESSLAGVLIALIRDYLRANNLGIVLAPDGMLRLAPDLVRLPDVSFLSWQQFPNTARPTEQILPNAPDLAVEILSPGNTEAEMQRKREEYFAAGTRLVWCLDHTSATVQVYTAPDRYITLAAYDELDGDDVLPGFRLRIREWIEQAWQPPTHPDTEGA